VASSCSVMICLSWVCHSNWQGQITAVATDTVELDAMEPDAIEPDAMEPDDGPEVYCRMKLVLATP
jgi:hypothetical protein